MALSDTAVQKTARLAELIADSFYGDGLNLSAREEGGGGMWWEMPEVGAVRRLRDLHASDRKVRLFLTLVSAMDRMRDANRLWETAAALYESRPDLFEPSAVAHMRVSRLREVLSAGEVSRFHRADSEAWKEDRCVADGGERPNAPGDRRGQRRRQRVADRRTE